VAQTALTSRRSANGRGARLAAFLSSLVFAFALGIGAIQHYSYEITPIFWDGVDEDAAVPFLWALPSDGIKDFSKHEKTFISWKPGEVIGSGSVNALSATTRSAVLIARTQHPLPLKLLPSAERRASGNASPDPD
jgi:hypothetical protein